jgi:hypothetical protein
VFTFFLLFAFDSGMTACRRDSGQRSAQFMISWLARCLLMIAGEFGLSVGSMVGLPAGMMITRSLAWCSHGPWLDIIVTFIVRRVWLAERLHRCENRRGFIVTFHDPVYFAALPFHPKPSRSKPSLAVFVGG